MVELEEVFHLDWWRKKMAQSCDLLAIEIGARGLPTLSGRGIAPPPFFLGVT
jgi:hypothetical protein